HVLGGIGEPSSDSPALVGGNRDRRCIRRRRFAPPVTAAGLSGSTWGPRGAVAPRDCRSAALNGTLSQGCGQLPIPRALGPGCMRMLVPATPRDRLGDEDALEASPRAMTPWRAPGSVMES